METLEAKVLTLELDMRKVNADLYGREGTDEPGLVKAFVQKEAEHVGQTKILKGLVAVVGSVQVIGGTILLAVHIWMLTHGR